MFSYCFGDRNEKEEAGKDEEEVGRYGFKRRESAMFQHFNEDVH